MALSPAPDGESLVPTGQTFKVFTQVSDVLKAPKERAMPNVLAAACIAIRWPFESRAFEIGPQGPWEDRSGSSRATPGQNQPVRRTTGRVLVRQQSVPLECTDTVLGGMLHNISRQVQISCRAGEPVSELSSKDHPPCNHSGKFPCNTYLALLRPQPGR
ncbi:MAG: hypothetical protein ACI9F9_001124 [Candidatus Paceibacteria bacterium]|jgi:hypothetical protein